MVYFTYYLIIMRVQKSDIESVMTKVLDDDKCITIQSIYKGQEYYWTSQNGTDLQRSLQLKLNATKPHSYFRVNKLSKNKIWIYQQFKYEN